MYTWPRRHGPLQTTSEEFSYTLHCDEEDLQARSGHVSSSVLSKECGFDGRIFYWTILEDWWAIYLQQKCEAYFSGKEMILQCCYITTFCCVINILQLKERENSVSLKQFFELLSHAAQ